MTDLLRDVDAPSDAELISRVRGGDVAAYGELFHRHKGAANRLARQLVRGPDSDDLVSEAFAKVLAVLQAGGGPDVAFRAYLLTAVRRLHIDRVRSGQRLQTTDDMTPFDPGVPFQDTAVAGFESGAAAKAFASLPERWQLVLWHLEVEGQKPAEIAPLLGMSANSVSALAYRAREGLRQAFLTMHLSDISDTECRWVNEHLGAFVRKGLSKRDAGKVQSHLDGCRRCTAMYLELDDVNSNLAAIIAPLLLGAAATGYLASGGAGAGGVLGVLSNAKELVGAHAGAATAAGVAATVAAATVVAVVISPGGAGPGRNPDVAADRPLGVSSGAPASPGSSASPTTASPNASPTASPTARPTASPTRSPTPTASPTAATPTPAASTSPSSVVVVPSTSASPSAQPSPSPSGGGSTSPTTSPTGAPTGSPSGPPTQPPTPARVIGDPVLQASGNVVVSVRNMRITDTLKVTIASDQTIFKTVPRVSTCSAVTSRHVNCLGLESALTVFDYSVTLPLAFPDDMVSDDVTVTASVGGTSSTTTDQTFRPSRLPIFDFTAPDLDLPASAHTVVGAEDRYGVTTTAVLPRGATGLVYTVSEPALFRPMDGIGCTVGDLARTLTCPSVVNGERVHLTLTSSSLQTRDVTVTVAPVDTFVDPPGNQTATVTLVPGVDLTMGGLTPTDPVPTGADYEVTSRLTGVRAGPVTFSVSGDATFTDISCAPALPDPDTVVTCADPANDTQVEFTLTPEVGSASTAVTIEAEAAPNLSELNAADNTASTSLAPDVVLDSVEVAAHGLSPLALVRTTLDGVPGGVDVIEIELSGVPVGIAAGRVHLTGGAAGADGQGNVDCNITNGTTSETVANAVVARCTGVATATSGRFFVDMRVAHPHGTDSNVTFTVTAIGADEGSAHRQNNERGLVIS